MQGNGLHRQGPDVHTRARHNSFSGDARHPTLLPNSAPSPKYKIASGCPSGCLYLGNNQLILALHHF
jgi:hypothetical protein